MDRNVLSLPTAKRKNNSKSTHFISTSSSSSSSSPQISMFGALVCINGNNPVIHTPSRSYPSRRLKHHKAMVVVTMATGSSHLTSVKADIEAHLKKALTIRPPLSVFEPMHHLVFAAPQTTAPALSVAACDLVGGHRDQAMAAATVLRVMHAAAFTHEQLPLTDRPRPNTRPKRTHSFGPNIKLLMGDGMIPFGVELLIKLDDPTQNNSDQILRVIIEITRAMGSQGIIEGQYNELQYNKSNDEEIFHMALIDKVYKKKEGELHACASACGAILGGGSEEEIEKLRRYGLYVGMIQGISNMDARKEKWVTEEVNGLKRLALQELRGFNQGKVEAISSFVETKFLH